MGFPLKTRRFRPIYSLLGEAEQPLRVPSPPGPVTIRARCGALLAPFRGGPQRRCEQRALLCLHQAGEGLKARIEHPKHGLGSLFKCVSRPNLDEHWVKFDDDNVTPCSDYAAVEDNFGGSDLSTCGSSRSHVMFMPFSRLDT